MTPYNPFIHLCRSLFLSRTDLMARLTVYCDDSGTHPESRVAVVAGFISTVSQWEIFQKEWRKVLRKNGIQILRRADLESYHGEFLKWDEARRRAFLEPLHRIIRRRIKVPIGQSVQRRDFEEIVPHDIKGKCGGIYGFLAHSCLVAVRTWCEKPSRQHTAPINWVFEAGTHGRKEFEEMLSFFLRACSL